MNKNILLMAPVVLFGLNDSLDVVAQPACEVPDIPPVCQAAPGLTLTQNSVNVSPPNICASAGQSIPVQVQPRGATARVVSKSGAPWLSGEGGNFTIDIPPGTTGEFDYAVYFSDGSCIDPRISVD